MKTMFLKQFSVQCRIIATIIALFLAVNSQAMATESGLLMGGLYAIGNDGAAEAGENPAYLAIAGSPAKHSAHIRSSGYNAGNIAISNQPVTEVSQQQTAFDAAFAWRELAGTKWSAGFSLGDIRQPTYQRLALEGKTFVPSTGFESRFSNSNIDLTQAAAVALGYALNKKESLGVRVRYTHRFTREKENVIAPISAVVTYAEELATEQRAHQLQATLSYLYRGSLGDFTILAGNLGSQQVLGSFAYSTAISANNIVAATTQDNAAHSNSGALDPFFVIGFRRQIFGLLNLFLEGGAQPTITQNISDNFYRKQGSQKATIRRDVTREGEIAYEAGAGFGLQLQENWTWHCGARYQTSRTRVTATAADNNSRYLDTTTVQFLQATTGFSWRRGSYLWQLGASYQYQEVDLEKKASFVESGTDKTTTTPVSVAVNTYGFFFAVAADF